MTDLADIHTKSLISILIVEDEFIIAMDLESRLLDAGFKVVGIAATADEAIDLARSNPPDIAVMDIRLIGPKDGVAAAIELFSAFGIRSIFASANADIATRKRAAAANPIGWLTKPYGGEELVAVIEQHFGSPS